MKIAEVLRSWRHHQEMTLREAAERVGVPASTYQRIERGHPMQGETLAAVLRWLLS
jgi:transcriptional regulator with XRE-family HTH domain